MARTLPWKKAGAQRDITRATAPTASPTSSSSSPPPPPRCSPLATKPSASEHGHTQSSSVSSPLKPKPMSERYMITGLQHDDRWRMVEDEFVSMAHKFTAHLHAAEYERLKEQAKDQNADAIRSLSRPVTGPMTDRVKRHKAAVALAKSQSSSMKRARSRVQDADDEDGDELPWVGTNLEGLMDSPRKKRISLAKVVTSSSDTRAAALLRKDSAKATAPPLARQRSVRFETDENKGGVRDQMTTTTLVSRNFDSRGSGFSTKDLNRASSVSSRGTASASVPVPQRPVPAPTASVPDDDSDSSVDLGFGDLFNKRRPSRRPR